MLYVLDEHLRPVPTGCAGELFVGGPQLTGGYLKNPEQTAKVFVDDPFRPGCHMYATGDLVRMNPSDESFTFIGRRDTQIKIRGLRVEIGEIEAVINAASSAIVNAAVVKVDIGRESLVAFLEYPSASRSTELALVVDDSLPSLIASLRHAVRQKLPSYMAPSTYVAVNKFPLTTSGKLDRKELSSFYCSHAEVIRELELDSETSGHGDPGVTDRTAPETEMQATVLSLWASVLRVPEGLLGINDDFYAAGGDSISAIRLASAAREAGLQLLATDIVKNPTIRSMASIAESAIFDHAFDVDDIPSATLDQMVPGDLALLQLNQDGLEKLRNDLLLEKYGLNPRCVLSMSTLSIHFSYEFI